MEKNEVNRLEVLDHGFVILRNAAGPTRRPDAEFDADDTDPANAARMSFDKMDSGRTREEDLKLCNYLMENWHTTPFESIELWIEMKMPIFVARQFVRHRTTSINEVSGRYVTLPDEWYIPALSDIVYKVKDKKQGGRPIDLDNPEEVLAGERYQMSLDDDCKNSYRKYLQYLEWGIAPEQARLSLHLNHYTHWLWKQDMHNIMHFLSLRDHSHAQGEAKTYAKQVDKLIRRVLPNTMSLYDEYRRME